MITYKFVMRYSLKSHTYANSKPSCTCDMRVIQMQLMYNHIKWNFRGYCDHKQNPKLYYEVYMNITIQLLGMRIKRYLVWPMIG